MVDLTNEISWFRPDLCVCETEVETEWELELERN